MLKYVLIISLILIPLIGLSMTALIMSTGKFWKCPGQPLVFTWLLGFGIVGILYSWFCIVIIVERILRRNIGDHRSRIYVIYAIIIIIFLLFCLIWSILGSSWTSEQSLKSTYYYLNGQNLYCDPVLLGYTQAMIYLNLLCFMLTIFLIISASKHCYY